MRLPHLRPSVRRAILSAEAADPATSPQRLARIFKYHARLPRRTTLQVLLAANPSTPSELLEKLSSSDSPAVLSAVAHNPTASTQMLEKVWEHAGDYLHTQVPLAANPATPPRILLSLAVRDPRDAYPAVAEALEANPQLPLIVALAVLACQESFTFNHDRLANRALARDPRLLLAESLRPSIQSTIGLMSAVNSVA